MTPRILILNPEFPPLGGGAANATFYLLKKFTKHPQIHFDLITSSTDEPRVENFASNITVHYLNIGKQGKNLHHQSNQELLRYSWQAYQYARRLMANHSYLLVHAFFGIPSGVIAYLLHRPYIVSLRGSDVPGYNQRFALADKFIFRHLSRFIWRHASAVIANSQGLKRLARQTSTTIPIQVIPNGIDTSEFFPASRQPRSTNLRILTVARLTPRKSIDKLIHACSTLNFKQWQLTIVGSGQEAEHLKSLVNQLQLTDKVTFLGNVEHHALPAIYRSHHIFVLPSQNEGMSNTILEAMASGLPIITTDTGGTHELIHGNGIIITSTSPQNIQNAILKYHSQPQTLTKHAHTSVKIARSFQWSEVATQYKKIYYQIHASN